MTRNKPNIEERFKIGKKHREDFKDLYTRASLIEESNDNLLIGFFFIKGIDLVSFNKLPSYNSLYSKLVPYKNAKQNLIFISHRWLSSKHPDPDGKKMELVKKHINHDAYYWIDYTCLPQNNRTEDEEKKFREILKLLPSLFFKVDFLIIRLDNDDYFKRAWCYLEHLAAVTFTGEINYIYETTPDKIGLSIEEEESLKNTLLTSQLPSFLLVTDPKDYVAITTATEALSIFSLLNVMYHYLILGQQVSNQEFFFGEDPYYFLATCNFSKLIEWTYTSSKKLGINWTQLSSNESTDNFFKKMAKLYNFKHNENVLEFSDCIVYDNKCTRWLLDNRFSKESEINLFIILTSLITSKKEQDLKNEINNKELKVEQENNNNIEFDESISRNECFEQIKYQKNGNEKRLSIEIECPPGEARPEDIFELTIQNTGLTSNDFFNDGKVIFGYTEYLVINNVDSIYKYKRVRQELKKRLTTFYKKGVIRAATW